MSTDKFSPKNPSPEGERGAESGHNSHRSIIRSTSVLSLGTLSSRILGFLRDVILAKLLGTGFRADAFFVAFKIPNLFRDLVGEGAINAAVVPVFAEYREHEKKEDFWRFVSLIFILSLILLSTITVVGFFFAPTIVKLIAPGFMANPEKLTLTIHLTKMMFPYLIFIGLTAYCFGILYTFRSFVVPAFSPCLLNISIIASAWFAARHMEEPVIGLAIGVIIGGVLQLLVQFRPLLKTGVKFSMPRKLNHPGALKIGKLLIPRIMGSGVYQLTVLVDTLCASLASIVGAGGISAIYYANRIIQFPMGVFSVALASAVLPSLSQLANKKDMDSIKKMIVFSIENIFFIMCPTTLILLLMSTPIVRVLFQRGEFGAYSTEITAWALAFYAIGLFSFGGIKILVTAFHALQDTKTPVKVAAGCLILNGALNLLLMHPLKIGGIALASAIAGTIDFLILFYIMEKKLGGLNSGLLPYFFKVALAAGIVGFVEFCFWEFFHFSHEVIQLFVMGFLGFFMYGILCYCLKVPQALKIWYYFKKYILKKS
ncbi:MAG: murein biosynthesis integral membrane protein MurJ [Candidatus Omnitrophica bacterium]|nr:murein biosynthesis integral membrane protein MurJ [Candidatus Omnitrophota bacterium]